MTSPTTPPAPGSPSNPTFIAPVTAPRLRVKGTSSTPPTPSPEPENHPAPQPDPVTGSGTRSSAAAADKPAVRAGASPWKNIARALVAASSAFTHEKVAQSEREIKDEVWVATATEQGQIGDPLAAILERHGVPVGENEDMNDLIAAGIGLLGYLGKNLAKTIMARLADRREKRAGAQVVEANPTPWNNA